MINTTVASLMNFLETLKKFRQPNMHWYEWAVIVVIKYAMSENINVAFVSVTMDITTKQDQFLCS